MTLWNFSHHGRGNDSKYSKRIRVTWKFFDVPSVQCHITPTWKSLTGPQLNYCDIIYNPRQILEKVKYNTVLEMTRRLLTFQHLQVGSYLNILPHCRWTKAHFVSSHSRFIKKSAFDLGNFKLYLALRIFFQKFDCENLDSNLSQGLDLD